MFSERHSSRPWKLNDELLAMQGVCTGQASHKSTCKLFSSLHILEGFKHFLSKRKWERKASSMMWPDGKWTSASVSVSVWLLGIWRFAGPNRCLRGRHAWSTSTSTTAYITRKQGLFPAFWTSDQVIKFPLLKRDNWTVYLAYLGPLLPCLEWFCCFFHFLFPFYFGVSQLVLLILKCLK
jgi:hypothetical protein